MKMSSLSSEKIGYFFGVKMIRGAYDLWVLEPEWDSSEFKKSQELRVFLHQKSPLWQFCLKVIQIRLVMISK